MRDSVTDRPESFCLWAGARYAGLTGVIEVFTEVMAADFRIGRNLAARHLRFAVEQGFLVKLRERLPRRGIDPGRPARYQLDPAWIKRAVAKTIEEVDALSGS